MEKKQLLEELLAVIKEDAKSTKELTHLNIAALEGRIHLINEEFHFANDSNDKKSLCEYAADLADLKVDSAELLAEAQNKSGALKKLVAELDKLLKD